MIIQFSVNPQAAQQLQTSGEDPIPILNNLDWTGTELARRLQDSVQNSTVAGICGNENVRTSFLLSML